MVEVMLRFGRRTFNISQKICNYSALKPIRKHEEGTVYASTLSTGVLFVDFNRDRDVKNRHLTHRTTRDVNGRFVDYCLGMKDNKSVSHTHASVWRGHGNALGIFFTTCPGSCLSHLTFIRTYVNGDRDEPLYRTKTGYYDILGVSPKATQAQIKTAYYKLCFLYHPDKNGGNDDATVRFSDISEAYAVLGHKGLRRKYDRGLLSQLDLTNRARAGPSATKSAAEGSAAARKRSAAVDPRGSMFDFDKFLRSHYGDQLQRDRDIRQRKDEMLRKRQESLGERNKDRAVEVGVLILLLTAAALLATSRGAAN